MDRLRAMSTFVRVVETGSFSAVAREQNSTQSAVSKQVAALERALGAKLLNRTTRSLALTDDGTRYFENARRLVAEIADAESALRRGEQQLTGWLRVGASVGYGGRVLMPLMQSILAEYPGLKIDLKLNDGFIDLVEEGIDVAVRIGDLVDSSLVARRVATTYRALVASRHYLRSLPKTLRSLREPSDLVHHNCIVYTELATRNEWVFAAGSGADAPLGSTQSVRVHGNLQTNSSESVRAAVLGGMGISYAPKWHFSEEIKSGEVQVLLPEWLSQPVPVHLVSPLQRRYVAKVKVFGDYVAQRLAMAEK